MAPGILVNNIHLNLGSHTVFEGLNLQFAGGKWHCILGRSGSGKSSFLRLVAGLIQPDCGEIQRDDNNTLYSNVILMSQDDGLLPWLSVIDNVQLGPRLQGTNNQSTYKRAKTLLQQVNLSGWHAALPGQLSGGMRQRVALARTLLEEQAIVLMDEPFSRLDAVTRDELQSLAFKLLANKTVILVTHDPLEALRMSHTITVLQMGTLEQSTTVCLPDAPMRLSDALGLQPQKNKIWHLLRNTPAEQAAY